MTDRRVLDQPLRRPAAALVALALLGMGCDSQPTTDVTPKTSPPTAASASPVGTTPSGSLKLTGWQQTHPGGTSITLHTIEVDDAGHLSLDVEVVTGPNDIELADLSTYLLDDLDVRHDLIAPDADNPDVAVPADSRARATFAFEEPIAPDATHVTFAVNALNDEIIDAEDDDAPDGSAPHLAFRDIPLPGIGLDEEADRGETIDLAEAQTVDVEITQTHTHGVVVTITRVASDTRSVHIDLEIDNPTDREVRLLSNLPHLFDAPGRTSRVGDYLWAESEERRARWLDVPPGGEASATLAFRGTVRSDATSLELILNGGTDDDARAPGFTFDDLPIPGRDSGTSTSLSPSDSPSPSASASPSD